MFVFGRGRTGAAGRSGADGAPFELEEIVAQLRELERHREVRVRRGRLWRVRQ